MSKNRHTAVQIDMACRHVRELMSAGVSENRAIRTLEHMVDRTAKLILDGYASPQSARKVPQERWSLAAKLAYEADPTAATGTYLRIEHGTPKRGLARLVMDLSESGGLTEKSFERLVSKLWKISVITHEEDERLNKIGRSKLFDSPDERWAAAGIAFSTQLSS